MNLSPEKISKSLGYNEKIMKKLPKGSNLELLCRNPLENLEMAERETLIDFGCVNGKNIFLISHKNKISSFRNSL